MGGDANSSGNKIIYKHNTTSSNSGVTTGVGKKNKGVTHLNMQNMINSDGPMILGPPDFMQHSSQNLVPKTNPTSMRDKFKMERPGKKILTPRGG